MKRLFTGILCIAILISSATIYAHSGRTDSSGGHKDNNNKSGLGSYHYHCGGNPPHLHSSGVCPYEKAASTPTPATTPQPTSAPISSPSQTQQPVSGPSSEQRGIISVYVDGTKIEFDQPPEMINGRVMVPIRLVVEKIGCIVEWDANTQTIYINESNSPLEKMAQKSENIKVYVNNELIVFDGQQPLILGGRTLVPVRYVVERLGYSVEWDNELQIVNIVKK